MRVPGKEQHIVANENLKVSRNTSALAGSVVTTTSFGQQKGQSVPLVQEMARLCMPVDMGRYIS